MGIIGAMNVSLSGMQVETRRMSVIANNVANMNTEGFRASRVVSSEVSTGGVSASVQDSGAPNPQMLRPGTSREIVELSNTDLATEVVNQRLALAAFQANAAVIKTADEMLGTAVNIRA